MIIETKEIYKCEHCRKLYQLKRFCIQHEGQCSKNPNNNRACFGCKSLCKRKTIVYDDGYNGEIESTVSILYCEKVDSFLYPPKVEAKKNWYETYSKPNNQMPRECQMFKHEFDTEENLPDFLK